MEVRDKMGIAVYVENQLHERTFAGVEAGDQLEWLIAEAPRGLLADIQLHGDTMFNIVQARRFLAELEGVRERRPDLAHAVVSLQELVRLAERKRGYLWFSGD